MLVETQPCCEAQEIPLNNPVNSAEETWNNSKLQRIKKSITEWGKAFTLQRLLAQRAKRNSKQQAPVGKRQRVNASKNTSWNDDYSVNNKPSWVELKVSNFCNQKCIMCSQHTVVTSVYRIWILLQSTQKDGHETRLLPLHSSLIALMNGLNYGSL